MVQPLKPAVTSRISNNGELNTDHLLSTSSWANFFRACWSTLLFPDWHRSAQLQQISCRPEHTVDMGRASMNETPPYSFMFDESSRAIHCVNSSMVSIEFGFLTTNP